jgi:hypothetical protein
LIVEKRTDQGFGCGCASTVVELWFAIADFPKSAEVCHWAFSRLVLVDERQLDFQFAVSAREDSYFTIAFSIAIRAGRFGSGGRREKSRSEDKCTEKVISDR